MAGKYTIAFFVSERGLGKIAGPLDNRYHI